LDFAGPSGALAVEYQALTVSMQRANVASCISSAVEAVGQVAAAGVSAGFDQPGAAASQAAGALVAGAVVTGVSCALAASPGGAAEPGNDLHLALGPMKTLKGFAAEKNAITWAHPMFEDIWRSGIGGAREKSLAIIDRVASLGGRISFDARPAFSESAALDPASEFFSSVLSTEFRKVSENPALRAITDIIRN